MLTIQHLGMSGELVRQATEVRAVEEETIDGIVTIERTVVYADTDTGSTMQFESGVLRVLNDAGIQVRRYELGGSLSHLAVNE